MVEVEAGRLAAGDEAVVGLGADVVGQPVEVGGVIGVHDAGGTGEVTQGVVEQLDGPGADHAVPQVRLGGLERVVPVAVAEGEEVGVADELFTEAAGGRG